MSGLCECGCGERTNLAPKNDPTKGWVKGEPLRFVNRHHVRNGRAKPPVRRGRENNHFNYGLCIRSDGRGVINCRDGALLMYARGVMAAHLGRLLRTDELVHHLNGDCSDDRIENLQIVTRAEHIDIHRVELEIARGIRHAA